MAVKIFFAVIGTISVLYITIVAISLIIEKDMATLSVEEEALLIIYEQVQNTQGIICDILLKFPKNPADWNEDMRVQYVTCIEMYTDKLTVLNDLIDRQDKYIFILGQLVIK